jgi:hypothetical protein
VFGIQAVGKSPHLCPIGIFRASGEARELSDAFIEGYIGTKPADEPATTAVGFATRAGGSAKRSVELAKPAGRSAKPAVEFAGPAGELSMNAVKVAKAAGGFATSAVRSAKAVGVVATTYGFFGVR